MKDTTRVIEFRGKRLNNKGWVYGYYMSDPKCTMPHVIFDGKDFIEVDPKTVGQFSGILTSAEVKIFEDDIVKVHKFLFDGYSEIEREAKGIIGYSDTSFTLDCIDNDFIEKYTGYAKGEAEFPLHSFFNITPIDSHYGLHEESFEVIGNIYDNPELLNR